MVSIIVSIFLVAFILCIISRHLMNEIENMNTIKKGTNDITNHWSVKIKAKRKVTSLLFL